MLYRLAIRLTDGSALYQSIAALFVAQMYGMHLTLSEQIVLMLTLMITSKGMAAVPGTSIVVLLTTLGRHGLTGTRFSINYWC